MGLIHIFLGFGKMSVCESWVRGRAGGDGGEEAARVSLVLLLPFGPYSIVLHGGTPCTRAVGRGSRPF